MAETKKRTKVKKIMGWKDCEIEQGDTIYDDIKQGSTSLSREEGQTTEAKIESGENEGVDKEPDKYILTCERRIGPDEDVHPSFKDNVGNVEVRPRRKGARSVKLTGVSQDVGVKFDSTDGAVVTYTWKTKGAVDEDGNLTDISIGKVGEVGTAGGSGASETSEASEASETSEG